MKPSSYVSRWIWVVGIEVTIICILLLTNFAQERQHVQSAQVSIESATSPTQQQVDMVTGQSEWTITDTFSGAGSKMTGQFAVPRTWKLQWTCYQVHTNIPFELTVYILNERGSQLAINTICQSGNVRGEVNEEVTGMLALNIHSAGEWKLAIQQLE